MGRWADMDSDEQRLPEGFQRVGYDADTQTYTFRDAGGNLYESEEGNRYGKLWPVGQRPQPSFEEVEATNAHLKKQNREAIRMMLPFALLVLIILLLLFKFISGGTGSGADGSRPQVHCSEGAHTIQVEKGQTCWSIAQDYGLGVSDLLELEGNENVDCDGLGVGQKVCVPK